jgi:hypothetical protein
MSCQETSHGVGIYWYDYRIGFAALLTLNLIHVVYEFPLNIISVKGIITALLPIKSKNPVIDRKEAQTILKRKI